MITNFCHLIKTFLVSHYCRFPFHSSLFLFFYSCSPSLPDVICFLWLQNYCTCLKNLGILYFLIKLLWISMPMCLCYFNAVKCRNFQLNLLHTEPLLCIVAPVFLPFCLPLWTAAQQNLLLETSPVLPVVLVQFPENYPSPSGKNKLLQMSACWTVLPSDSIVSSKLMICFFRMLSVSSRIIIFIICHLFKIEHYFNPMSI